jgi:carboxyl-terminal processing protease
MFKKRFFTITLLLVINVLATAGCIPEDQTLEVSAAAVSSAAATRQTARPLSAEVRAVVDYILAGDFEAAAEAVASVEGGSKTTLKEVAELARNWSASKARRDNLRSRVLEMQQQELLKLQSQYPNLLAADPNKTDEVLAIGVRLKDLANGDQEKRAVLEHPVLREAIRVALLRAREYEAKGQWSDAYVHAYYWLTELYPDNTRYKDEADRLTELVTIELALKDGTCNDTSRERHKGIEPDMFLRALHLLEGNYVSPPDYPLMLEKALTRSRLLADVFEKSKEKLAWKINPSQLDNYRAGVATLEAKVKAMSKPGSVELIRLFQDVMNLNADTLELPQEVIVAQFSEGALSALDPFTNLVWPWYVEDFEKSLTQQFFGIGVEISKATGVLKVVSLLPDTPAYRSGLDAEDEIVKVNGEATEDMTITCAVSKITGPKGTKVTLTIRRPSTGVVKDYVITRDKIVVQPIRGWQRAENGGWDYWVDPENRIGYVRLTAFTESSGPDLDKILTTLERQGMRGLILDLRYNSGGYLESAAQVVDLFVEDGVIVKSSPRHGFPTYEIAHKRGTHPRYPLVVLINGGSASASEIVAGALQDPKFNRAVIVGSRSYGKGSVQVVTPYTGGNSQLKYTIAYYHLPSDQQVKNRYQMEKLGRTDWGIAPDVEVEMYNHELRRMIDVQRDNDVLVRADHNNDGDPMVRHDLRRTLLSDPQLSVALLVAQAQLIQSGMEVTARPASYWNLPIDPNEIM